MVLYLAREYKSAGVVSRIATTRKKVEGIKRCSLLFDRERRRFLFAKRAFSRFDVLAFVLLRLFSLSFCDIFLLCAHQIRLVSFGLVEQKKIEQQQNKEKERVWREEKLFPFFFFFSLSNKEKNTRETFESGEGEKPKKKQKKKARQSQTNNKKKRGRERRKRESDCLVFVFIRIIHHREALSLWRLESRLRSLASDTTLESASSSRNAFRGEREREFARFSRRENVRFFFLGNFKRLRETAFEI